MSFLRTILLVAAQGPAGRAAQRRDPLHHGVLRGVVRAGLRLRIRARGAGPSRTWRAGILWIAIAFSGTLALGRTFERERQSETLRALIMAPVDRPALYVAKLIGVTTLMAVVELLIVPLVALLFQAPLFRHAADDRGAARRGHRRLHRGRHAVRRDARPRPQPRRAAADPAVSADRAGHHRRRARDRGAARSPNPTWRWRGCGSRCSSLSM